MFRDVFSSLRVRLLLLVLLASLPAFAIIFHAGLEQRRMGARAAVEEMQRLVGMLTHEQSHLLETTQHLLAVLARLPEVRRLDGPACSALFADLLRQYPAYSNLIAIEPDGDVFCSAVPSPRPVNLADRSYFQRVLRTRDFVIGEYIIGRITGLPNMPLVYPALDESGRVVVVVFAALDLSWLKRLAVKTRLPEDASVLVVDRDGIVLARHPDLEQWVGRSARTPPLLQAILRQGEGTAEAAGVDGVRRLYAFTTLGDTARTGGAYVAIGFPITHVYAAVNRLMARNLGVCPRNGAHVDAREPKPSQGRGLGAWGRGREAHHLVSLTLPAPPGPSVLPETACTRCAPE